MNLNMHRSAGLLAVGAMAALATVGNPIDVRARTDRAPIVAPHDATMTGRNRKRMDKKHARTLAGRKKQKLERRQAKKTRRHSAPDPIRLTNWQRCQFQRARTPDAKAAMSLLHPHKVRAFQTLRGHPQVEALLAAHTNARAILSA